MNKIERLRKNARPSKAWTTVSITTRDFTDLLDLVEKQHEAVEQLGNHYCGTHDEDAPYHDVDPDDVMNTCEGCARTVRIFRAALTAYNEFTGEDS